MKQINGSSNLEDNKKKQKFVIITTIALILCCFMLLFFYQGKHRLNLPSIKNKERLKKSKGIERVRVTFNTGIDGRLGIVMSIPVDHEDQRQDILENYPKLKNAFLMKVEPKEMNGWVEERNYNAIRRKFLEILNGILEKPVEKVYFDSFFYD